MLEFIEIAVKLLVDKPDEVKVNIVETEQRVIYELTVGEGDYGKVIGKHGIEVGKKLGYMLSGGATTPSKILTEQNLYDLEREIFIDLISQKPTQERIRHTLDTGKPLFN